MNRFEFLSGIEGPVFGGEGKVYHAREDHVFVVGIVEEGFQQRFNFAGKHFPVVAGNGQDLVSGIFDGPGFMDGDVARLCGDNALPALQEAADDGLVGLGAACQEEHAGIGTAARAGDFFTGRSGIFVGSIAGLRNEVGFGQPFQDARMGALRVVANEG